LAEIAELSEVPNIKFNIHEDLAHLAYTGGTTGLSKGIMLTHYNATIIGGAPQHYIPLINLPDFDAHDLSSVKLASSGAAPLAMPVLDKMLKAFSGVVCEAYGLTECTMGATTNPPDRANIRQGSVGISVLDTECKVVDLETGEDLPPGKKDEICIKGGVNSMSNNRDKIGMISSMRFADR
jgi:acyl-CoA synthetase (AMP-forming)/AMP-acid ligase II